MSVREAEKQVDHKPVGSPGEGHTQVSVKVSGQINSVFLCKHISDSQLQRREEGKTKANPPSELWGRPGFLTF